MELEEALEILNKEYRPITMDQAEKNMYWIMKKHYEQKPRCVHCDIASENLKLIEENSKLTEGEKKIET
jgi:hypothetical protein